ncbi:Neuronal membrane glycoprotein M6-b [Fasciolopsis buskii]|uniref:Neuronal membrane glycoprotein M6-b n=1 Tax=Fasciolopsis buskii TaxID=27845 RepID=A0A8E0S049_9TREM|nr:Neuronal membrane glycoprotein M6-b [Fasciolopsis buski]
MSRPQLIQIIGVIYAVFTMLFGLANVIAGALSTGRSRQKVYASRQAITCGLRSSRCLLVTTYLVTLAWLFLFVAFAVPTSLWSMLHTVCRHETDYWRSINADKDETQFTYTFNLTHYGLYRRPLDTSLYNEYVNSPSGFTQLCQEVSTVGPLFVIALFASFLVLIGLNCFAACLSSAIVRLDYAPEVERYRRFIASPVGNLGNSEAYSLHPLINHGTINQRTGVDAHGNSFVFNETASTSALPTAAYQYPGGGTSTIIDQSQTMPFSHHLQTYPVQPTYQPNR